MTLLDMALELGREISRTEEYKQMKLSEENLRNDKDGQKLIHDFQALKNVYERKAMGGKEITEENIKELEELEKKAMENKTVSFYFNSTRRFQELIENINRKIHEGIIHED